MGSIPISSTFERLYMKLFLFYDSLEEFLVVANDRNDAFMVIEERYGAEAADELIMSKMIEYPDDFQMTSDKTVADVIASGRGLKSWVLLEGDPSPRRIPRPAA
jgi:hypothetical protein